MTLGRILFIITIIWLCYIALTNDGSRQQPDLLLEDANANALQLRDGVR